MSHIAQNVDSGYIVPRNEKSCFCVQIKLVNQLAIKLPSHFFCVQIKVVNQMKIKLPFSVP